MTEEHRLIRVEPEDIHTDITFILDRSGSMASIKGDVIGGFSEFLREQKEVEGRATFTLILFDGKENDDWYISHCNAMDIQVVEPLDDRTFVPRGWTPLLDAVSKAVRETEERLNKISEDNKPHKVIFVILTDGEENNSSETTKEQLFEQITGKRGQGWEFVFLGANQDAFAEAGSMGIGMGQTLVYAAQEHFTSSAIKGLSNSMSSFRSDSSRGATYSFNVSDRQTQEESGDQFTQGQTNDNKGRSPSPRKIDRSGGNDVNG